MPSPSSCMNCYEEGLQKFVDMRSHRVALSTMNTYLSDGRRFKNFFIEGVMRVKGTMQTTTSRGVGGKVSLDDFDVFADALIAGGMAPGSALVYRTPVEGAFHFASHCTH